MRVWLVLCFTEVSSFSALVWGLCLLKGWALLFLCVCFVLCNGVWCIVLIV